MNTQALSQSVSYMIDSLEVRGYSVAHLKADLLWEVRNLDLTNRYQVNGFIQYLRSLEIQITGEY